MAFSGYYRYVSSGLAKYDYNWEEFLFRLVYRFWTILTLLVSPVVENTLSASVDVAGIHRYFVATRATKGKWFI